MRILLRKLFIGAFVLVGACAPHINDVRLESVRPVAGTQIPTRTPEHDEQRFGGIVVEFSSESDLRRQVARFGTSFFAVVERCMGRTHIDDLWDPDARIGTGDFFDEFGVLSDAGRGSPANPERPSPVSGEPRDGRFFFRLPIHLETYAQQQPIVAGRVVRSVIYHDLRRDMEDLCVFARGWTYLAGVWRSNTVVIPYSSIRAALDRSPTP